MSDPDRLLRAHDPEGCGNRFCDCVPRPASQKLSWSVGICANYQALLRIIFALFANIRIIRDIIRIIREYSHYSRYSRYSHDYSRIFIRIFDYSRIMAKPIIRAANTSLTMIREQPLRKLTT